ncbi:MAG: hypothetical protein H6726_18925 [Sandaracinaceae bacterium]|nr:hypothetical protein [Sandaracinaceae bacterium]
MSDHRATVQAAQRAFDAGDFHEVRRLVGPLANDTEADAETMREALSLLGKVSADPAQYVVLGLSLLFFLLATWRFALS